ncbi:unnamed protein product [Meganyctiphanes norvegica]|uniref:C2H2-type domain-containing protein n=1 Tax=Meganyctiphanes norvegica TaxID=48144 RepID=A0AAV2RPV5_MEGNR
MSESFVEEECESKIDQGFSLYNITQNKEVEVKHDNVKIIKPDDSYYTQKVLWKLPYGHCKVKVKEETKVIEAKINIQDVHIKLEKFEIYEEPILAFTGECYLVKHELTHTLGCESSHHDVHRCNFWDKVFSQNKQLVIHLGSHLRVTIQRLDTHPVPVPVYTEESPYKCKQCDKTFPHSRREHLVRHLDIHTGDKPYRCNRCEKDFSQNSIFTIHPRTHHREKPYKCSQCDRAYSENNHLIVHLRIHTSLLFIVSDVTGAFHVEVLL